MRMIPNAFRIVAACCRWPSSDERTQAIRAAASGSFSWPDVMKIARRHRVEGLVADGLKQAGLAVPAPVQEDLARAASMIARRNLEMAIESHRLQRLAERDGIRMILLKGITLNILAYHTLAIKKSWDIDLLVDRAALDAACALLRGAGYARRIPGPELDEAQARQWLALSKESLWIHEEKGHAVELHIALADNPAILSGVTLQSPRQTVDVAPGMAVTTFADAELVSYLCVHGATHGWSRLKWLADLAALIAGRSGEEIDRLYRRTIELGAGRSSAQALLLCERLLGTSLPKTLRDELEGDAGTRWLVRIALRTMAGKYVDRELDESMLGTFSIQLSHFLIGRGLRHKRAELCQKLKNPHGPAMLGMPRHVAFLSPLLSVPHWLWRRAKHKDAQRLAKGP